MIIRKYGQSLWLPGATEANPWECRLMTPQNFWGASEEFPFVFHPFIGRRELWTFRRSEPLPVSSLRWLYCQHSTIRRLWSPAANMRRRPLQQQSTVQTSVENNFFCQKFCYLNSIIIITCSYTWFNWVPITYLVYLMNINWFLVLIHLIFIKMC